MPRSSSRKSSFSQDTSIMDFQSHFMDIIALHDFVFLFGTLSLLNMNVWYFRLLQFFCNVIIFCICSFYISISFRSYLILQELRLVFSIFKLLYFVVYNSY